MACLRFWTFDCIVLAPLQQQTDEPLGGPQVQDLDMTSEHRLKDLFRNAGLACSSLTQ